MNEVESNVLFWQQWKKSDDTKTIDKGFSLPEAVPKGCQIVPLKEKDSLD